MYLRSILALLLLAAVPAVCRSAQTAPVTTSAADEVSLQLSMDGGLEVTAPAYQARIGSDGNLHSLRVGETEMLDDRVSFSLGAFFFAGGQARRLGRITLPAPAVVQASDGIHTARYQFLPGEIRLLLSQSSEKKVPFYLVLADAISVVANSRTGEVAATPTEEDWPDVTFTAASGAYITLRGGDRIWGPWSKRQMWELGPIIAGQPREISINPGVGPAPQPTPAQLLSLRAETVDSRQILQFGRSAQLAVIVENRGKPLNDGLLSVYLRKERGGAVSELAQHIYIGEKSQAQGRFDISLPEPGVYSAQIILSSKNRPLKETGVMFAFRADDIRPPLNIPPDFSSFWEAVLAESRLPSDEPVEFVSDESLSTPQLKVWRVGFTGAGGKRLYGWLCAPAQPGPHPGLLQLPVYGRPRLEPPLVLADRGYVALAVEVVEEGTETAYIASSLEDPKNYPYRAITLNALHALDVLMSRPEVDPRRVAASGASQGGGLALILAALRPEITAVTADVPMLCDLPRSVREGGWPYSEIANYLQSHPETEARAQQTLRYFDVLNFAPRIQSPALLSLGLRDTMCRPETIFAAYNYLAGSKALKVYAEAGHEGGGVTHWIHKLQWLDSLLKPSPYLLTSGENGEGGSLEPNTSTE